MSRVVVSAFKISYIKSKKPMKSGKSREPKAVFKKKSLPKRMSPKIRSKALRMRIVMAGSYPEMRFFRRIPTPETPPMTMSLGFRKKLKEKEASATPKMMFTHSFSFFLKSFFLSIAYLRLYSDFR